MEDVVKVVLSKLERCNGHCAVTVEEIIRLCKNHVLGIPHFQRGLVWSESQKGALLESLLEDTPVGTIVLWKCSSDKEGVPYPEVDTKDKNRKPENSFQYLIIDGQQRIRTIYELLEIITDTDKELNRSYDAEKSHDGDIRSSEIQSCDGVSKESVRKWVINLKRVYELIGKRQNDFPNLSKCKFKNLSAKTSSQVFLTSRLPPLSKRKMPYVPLSDVLRDSMGEYDWLPEFVDSNVKISNIGSELNKYLRTLRKKNVAIVIPNFPSDVEKAHDAAIRTYIRINTSGVRAKSEEVLYPHLLYFYPKLAEKLHIIHDGDRDRVLRRSKEHSDSFRRIIRTFAAVIQYHRVVPLRYFGSLNHSDFSKYLEGICDKDWDKIYKKAEIINKCIQQLFENCLHCDWPQREPPQFVSQLLMLILLRFPEVMTEKGDMMDDSTKAALTYLALQISLSKSLTSFNLRVERDIYLIVLNSVRFNQCFKNIIEKLKKQDESVQNEEQHNSKCKFCCINIEASVLDPTVNILYWLLRKKKARDFPHEVQKFYDSKGERYKKHDNCTICKKTQDNLLAYKGQPEMLIPEVQHIVPYSFFKPKDRNIQVGRVGKHVANHVGNLTFISRILNNSETGLGADFARLDEKSKEDHLFGNSIECYNNLKERCEKQEKIELKQDDKDFREFIRARGKKICGELKNWLEVLKAHTNSLKQDIFAEPPLLPWYTVMEDDEVQQQEQIDSDAKSVCIPNNAWKREGVDLKTAVMDIVLYYGRKYKLVRDVIDKLLELGDVEGFRTRPSLRKVNKKQQAGIDIVLNNKNKRAMLISVLFEREGKVKFSLGSTLKDKGKYNIGEDTLKKIECEDGVDTSKLTLQFMKEKVEAIQEALSQVKNVDA